MKHVPLCFTVIISAFALPALAEQITLAQQRPGINSGVPFIAQEFASHLDENTGELKEGKGSISGYAFNKIKPGLSQPASGATVYLVPTHPYTDNMYMLGQFQSSATTRDANIRKYTRSTSADAQGKFTFEKIPPGAYTLEVSLRGIRFNNRTFGQSTDKIALLRITLADGEQKNVQLTNRF